VATALTLVSFVAFFTYLPKSPVWKRLGQEMRQQAELYEVLHLLGQTGVSTSELRPGGSAEIEGLRLEVVTEGDFLPAGTPIVVTDIEGSRIIVADARTLRTREGSAAVG
jgi:membrane-bound serine protease (ClpP class)